jgi:hypothetical protein
MLEQHQPLIINQLLIMVQEFKSLINLPTIKPILQETQELILDSKLLLLTEHQSHNQLTIMLSPMKIELVPLILILNVFIV